MTRKPSTSTELPITVEIPSPAMKVGNIFMTGYHGGAYIDASWLVIRECAPEQPGIAVRIVAEETRREGRFVTRIGWRGADGVLYADDGSVLQVSG